MFSKNTYSIVYGVQLKAIQNMLDFDFLCGRDPSVLAIINPQSREIQNYKIFFGDREIFIPSYPNFLDVPEYISVRTDTLVNFASHRSAYISTIEAMGTDLFQTIVIIAEGIPERETREIIAANKQKNINIIGPATVGAMKAGIFRAGNTGGSLENIIDSKLYRPGRVGFVSKSGGMSNELRRVIADRTSGTSLSIALGGDRFSVMEFEQAIDILEDDDSVELIVMLGEVGGNSELKIAERIKTGKITKPVIAWCIGTIDDLISGDVQFGHAGAKSNSQQETAIYKNRILAESGACVPNSYMDLGDVIESEYKKLPAKKTLEPDRNIAGLLEQITKRNPSHFTSTISDERGEELEYNHRRITEYVKRGSIASVISNLWLKRDLPSYGDDFLNTVIILLADHGPAVSGAHNSIVAARAGNDIKSSLISGLTTIGPSFGGAIDGAAKYFFEAVQDNMDPRDFVEHMKASGKRIPGIGHKVKSKFNPDKRCEILLEKKAKFKNTRYIDFALSVEKITLEKKSNLILNVDGCIAAMLLDLFEDIAMSHSEIKVYIDAGICNGFFILARSIGFIGHVIDQKRLGEGLYRTPWEDILYE
ncbi:ATP citrate synthase [Candidatus Gracilibacteria bacterium]|nr:ATP citrate synthase [Candidatus Gracilibacteria bacterium]